MIIYAFIDNICIFGNSKEIFFSSLLFSHINASLGGSTALFMSMNVGSSAFFSYVLLLKCTHYTSSSWERDSKLAAHRALWALIKKLITKEVVRRWWWCWMDMRGKKSQHNILLFILFFPKPKKRNTLTWDTFVVWFLIPAHDCGNREICATFWRWARFGHSCRLVVIIIVACRQLVAFQWAHYHVPQNIFHLNFLFSLSHV